MGKSKEIHKTSDAVEVKEGFDSGVCMVLYADGKSTELLDSRCIYRNWLNNSATCCSICQPTIQPATHLVTALYRRYFVSLRKEEKKQTDE
jgi:hypothetical protein